jgi:YidC/Oxa1 family membrane protein insertase
MFWLYHTILYQPLYNLLILFYNFIPWHDLGLAIILLTVLIKLILYPLSQQSIKAQKALQDLQPRIDELKVKFKDNKEAQAQEMMKLYKETKVNPFSSCLPLLVQIPFLIAVYQVFRTGLSSNHAELLYSFVSNPGTVNHLFLGFMNLSTANIVLAIIAGAGQFLQTKMFMTKKPAIKSEGSKDENLMAEMNKSMMYFMPIMTIVIGASLPAGLTLYWVTMTLLTILQQYFVLKNHNQSSQAPKIIDIKPANQ